MRAHVRGGRGGGGKEEVYFQMCAAFVMEICPMHAPIAG